MKETVSVNGIVNDRSDPLSKKSPKLGMLIIRVISKRGGRSEEAKQQPVASRECAWDTLELRAALWQPRRSTLEGPSKTYNIVFL